MHNLLLKGKFIGKIKGVLFDKDGTLSNSEDYLINLSKARVKFSLEKFYKLKTKRNELLKMESILKSLYGLSKSGLNPTSLIAIASREQNLISTATVFSLFGKDWPTSIDLAKEVFVEADQANNTKGKLKGSKERPIINGAKTFLSSLEKAKIKSGLITNDSVSGAQEFITTNNFEKTFNYFWTAENHPCKPDPYAVIQMCLSMKLDPSECALISDADTDLKMAVGAGIGVIIGFRGGWKIRPDLRQSNLLINNWDELEIHKNP